MAVFFSIVTLGLAATLPTSLTNGLTQSGLAAPIASAVGHLPPIAALFGAFLGYNPMQTLVPASALAQLTSASRANILGQSFFPNLISDPFMAGLHLAFYLSAALCLISAVASLFRGKTQPNTEPVLEIAVETLDGDEVSLVD
jgi:hypothetical protein